MDRDNQEQDVHHEKRRQACVKFVDIIRRQSIDNGIVDTQTTGTLGQFSFPRQLSRFAAVALVLVKRDYD